jgi:predicted phosphate transport protein (TIGR00153 family)
VFFKSKQNKIETLLKEYRGQVERCLERYRETFAHLASTSDRTMLEQHAAEVRAFESAGDDIRRSIEDLMYTRALFPESRGDILGLLESLDKVPNQAQTAVRMVLHQNIMVPPELWPLFLEQVDMVIRCASAMLEAADKLFTDFTGAMVAVGRVDELESQADRLTTEIIQKVFAGQLDGVQKILLRDLAYAVEQLSDRAQDTADRIRIIVAKRKY